MSKFSEILILVCRKIFSAFHAILAVTTAKNNSKLIKENENHITKWTVFVCEKKNMEHIKTTVVVFHSLWPTIPFNSIS